MSINKADQKNGVLVLPGERLGVIEEFIPDSGTYVKDGVIYSKIIGRALMDLLNKKVSVYPIMGGVATPKVGSIILGQVGNAQTDNVLVKIFKIGNKQLSGTFGGILHISDVADRYVDSMNDVCKPGDIVRAKVISTKNQVYHLSTSERNLGILYAFCSRCGNLLDLQKYEMHCSKCGNVERRKTAPEYGQDPL
jgi:exosome complex component CSL4